jgi:hypothetical protein
MKLISKALVEFQTKLKPISKDAENPFFKSDYLSLSGILEQVIPLLSSVGISMTQPMRVDAEKTILITDLTHESGEKITSEIILPYHADPQKMGSLITYYKRYQLQAILGVSSKDDDDDGQSVSSSNKTSNYAPENKPSVNSSDLASPAQVNALKKLYPNEDLTGLTKSKAKSMFDNLNKGN